MNTRVQAPMKSNSTPTPSFTPVRSGLLQRKCACGGAAGLSGECAACRKQPIASGAPRLSLTRQPVPRTTLKPHRGYEFSRLEVYAQAEASPARTAQPVHGNAATEYDPIHQPLLEEFRRRETDAGIPPGLERSEAEIKYLGLGLQCPARTEVERMVDLTAAGLRDGFRTAYGAMAVMQVQPREGIWNGTQIAESLTEVSSTCPATLSHDLICSGSSVFTVGASGSSSRIGLQPGLINRFYDFHVSRSRSISFLHDTTRNPSGLDACHVTCKQQYSCGGDVIGTHNVTRNFRKGTHNSQDVTIVDVTKT